MRDVDRADDEDAGPEPLLTTAEMSAVDHVAAASGLAAEALITRAGEACARAVMGATSAGARIAVIAGPGANGCDGLLAAAGLKRAGFAVTVFCEHAPAPGTVAAWAADQWGGPRQSMARLQPRHFDLVLDALYGAGLSRPIFGIEADAVERLNASRVPVVAVDVPSGLHGDTGQPLGPCVQAARTVTFFRLKPGHVLWPGRSLCGAVEVAGIGLNEAHLALAARPSAFVNAPALWHGAVPAPAADGHKYRRGHVLVVSGSELQTGASRLAAWAALHAGAGAVTIAGDRDALRVHAAHVTAIMLKAAARPADLAALLSHSRVTAAVIGPAAGVGEDTVARAQALIAARVPTVLDADALTSLAGRAAWLATRGHGEPALVLTPHAGEFDRLFAAELQGEQGFAHLPAHLRTSKLEKARAAARIAAAVVVLKGVDTVIAAPDGRAAVNVNAGPELATAGSGDVLAGIVACQLGQGMPAFEAACAGVWLHGAAGARIGAGLTAERLAQGVRPLASMV